VNEDGDSVTWRGGDNLNVQGKTLIDIYSTVTPQNHSSQARMAPLQFENFVGGVVTLDPEAGLARLCFLLNGGYDVNLEADGQSQTLPGFISSFLLFDKMDGALGVLPCVNMILNNDYSITEGSRTIQIEEVTIVVEWTRMEPVAPPDDQTPG
jgi:hypothetical protein